MLLSNNFLNNNDFYFWLDTFCSIMEGSIRLINYANYPWYWRIKKKYYIAFGLMSHSTHIFLPLSFSLSLYIYIYIHIYDVHTIYICIYIYIYIYIYEVHTISFQIFFVWAFKIVVDSWKFSMLLLYIIWDNRPIFMISASNEQLQQQLEYTLLKPEWHSWWVSKMTSDTLEERYAIKLCFKLGKTATETYGKFQTAFRPSCMNWASVSEWHKRFKEGRGSVRDYERCGRSKEVNTPELIGQRVRVRVTMLRV